MARKLILKHFLSPGDVVLLTAAIRDLHKCHPNEFLTDVRTSCPQLSENNPYLTTLDENDPEISIIECHYPLINESNARPFHFIHGFTQFLVGGMRKGVYTLVASCPHPGGSTCGSTRSPLPRQG